MTYKKPNEDDSKSSNTLDDRSTKTTECCAVCGDLATGFHYEVASCNGCKTFFRRTLVSNRTYKCHKNGNCTFDKNMRCACRACRFDKCVAVGMNPKAIQCNRTGRLVQPQEATISTTSLNSPSESEIPQQHASTSNSMEKELNQLFPDTGDSSRKRSLTSPDSELGSKRAYTISALLDFPPSVGIQNMDENSSFKRSQPEGPSSSSTSDITYNIRDALRKYCSISEKHEKLISQLTRAQESINEMLDAKDCDNSVTVLDILARPSVTTAIPLENKFICKNENYCSNGPSAVLNQKLAVAVEYAKTFGFFQWMPVQDKILLLRDVAFVLILLETAYERSSSKSASVLNHKNDKEPSKSDEENIGMSVIIESFNRAKLDKKEFLLLKAIAFVHSECFGLSRDSYRQLIHQRQLMLDTLFNYMMSQHDKQGPVRFGHALSVLWSVYKATNSYLESLMNMGLEPLTEELLANKLPERLS